MEKSNLQFNKEGLERNNVYALRALLRMYGIPRRPGTSGKTGEKTRIEMLDAIRASDRYHEDIKNQTVEGQPRASSTIKLDGDPLVIPDKLLNPKRPASKPKKKEAKPTIPQPTPDSKPAEMEPPKSRIPGADQPEELPKKKREPVNKSKPGQSEYSKNLELTGESHYGDPRHNWPIKSSTLQVVPIYGDGNCLFRALAWWRYAGKDDQYKKVRKEVVDWVAKNTDAPLSYPGDSRMLDEVLDEDWVNEMKKDGVYGDDVVIRGAATLYGVNIFMACSINTPIRDNTSELAKGYQKFFPVDIDKADETWGIVLQYHEKGAKRHYDVLTPKGTKVPRAWNMSWKQFYKHR